MVAWSGWRTDGESHEWKESLYGYELGVFDGYGFVLLVPAVNGTLSTFPQTLVGPAHEI